MEMMKSMIIISLYVGSFGSLISKISCVEDKSSVNNNDKSKSRVTWDDNKKIKLLKIFYKTKTGEGSHRKRIKEEWDHLQVMKRNQTARNLHARAVDWIKKGEAERLLTEEERQFENSELRKNKIKWTPELKEDILKFYNESDKETWGQSRRIKELWDKKYPNHPEVTSHNIMVRIGHILKERGEVTNPKRGPFTREVKENLVRCYHMTQKKKKGRLNMTRDLFIKKYPQLANVTSKYLCSRLFYFRKYHPEIDKRILQELSASDTIHRLWEPEEAMKSTQGESTSISEIHSHDSNEQLGQHFDAHHLWEVGEASGTRQQESTSIPTFQSYVSHRVSGQHSVPKHVLLPGEELRLKRRKHTYTPTSQSHNFPGLSEKYFNPNHSQLPVETSRIKQEKSTSTQTSQSYNFPGTSEQYFDPSRDNAWIDHMIQEASFSNVHALTDEDTSHQNINRNDIWNRSELESYQHNSHRGQSKSSKGKQLAFQ